MSIVKMGDYYKEKWLEQSEKIAVALKTLDEYYKMPQGNLSRADDCRQVIYKTAEILQRLSLCLAGEPTK